MGQSDLPPKPGQPEDLTKKYNFTSTKVGYSGNKKLAVMAMRQEIVDAIEQNQVRFTPSSIHIVQSRAERALGSLER